MFNTQIFLLKSPAVNILAGGQVRKRFVSELTGRCVNHAVEEFDKLSDRSMILPTDKFAI